ncbi:hypothetical protein ABZ726_01640 [Streptomyces hundungensis]|uniref:hypothetical protein n=1 Tax=Streptomyces hundungensis TaxID=1077946 RepID=UPI00340DD53F
MGTFLRRLLDDRQLQDYEAFLPQFKRAAAELAEAEDNGSLQSLVPAYKTFQAWYLGTRQPQRDARRVLVHMLGYTIEQLWSTVPDNSTPNIKPLVGDDRITSHAVPGVDLNQMRRTGAMAARRAMDFALGAERNLVGEETLGFLGDEVKRIAEIYPRVPLSEVWEDLAQAQDEAFRLMESGRARPSQSRDLHFMATVLSFLMAKGSHDMGDSRTAMMQARTAGFCARQAEHPGLIALVDGLQSLISYWADRPEDALHYARKGAETATGLRGTVAIWLTGLEARAAALLGDAETARAAVHRSDALRDRAVADDLDSLGGLFTYPVIKQNYYAVETEVLLGHGDARIAAQAEQAVRDFSDRENPAWAFGDQAGSQCNLALVRLHAGDLDGTTDAIRPVLELTPSHRNNGIVLSAERVRAALARSDARDAVAARDLSTEIALFRPSRPALPR